MVWPTAAAAVTPKRPARLANWRVAPQSQGAAIDLLASTDLKKTVALGRNRSRLKRLQSRAAA